MRVLQVVTKSEVGGAQTHVWQLATFLQDRGHDVHITAAPGGWLHDQARKRAIPFHANDGLSNRLDLRAGLRAGRAIAALAAQFSPDIIHCHSSAAGFWARVVVRSSVPTVFTAHGWGFTPGAPRLRRIALLLAERLVARFTTRYICVSEYDGRLAVKFAIAEAGKIAIIHNGVELQEMRARRARSDPNATIKAVFLGRLARPKEPELVLTALSELPEPVRNAYELWIVGDGPLLAELRALLAVSPVRARLTGSLERGEALRTLSESQVFVLASRYEGLPISILEAMSMGLAVIASDVGGIREAVTPECGILVPRGDKEALKRALIRLAEDESARARFGAAARERVRREFSVTDMCEKTIAVYESVRAQ
jgi:glycosyltransferase involved in cell wall biosynthesis